MRPTPILLRSTGARHAASHVRWAARCVAGVGVGEGLALGLAATAASTLGARKERPHDYNGDGRSARTCLETCAGAVGLLQ